MRYPTYSTIVSCNLIIYGLLVRGSPLQPSGLAPPPPKPPKEQCPDTIDLTPDTWNKLEMDEYIASIDGIDKMNLAEFSRAVGAANFVCGIGLFCSAGQLCNRVAGKNWLVLVAIQHWNTYLNVVYQGISNAITIVRDTSADMITDFIPDTVMDHSIFGWAVATLVLGILAGFSGVLTPILAVEPVIETIAAYGTAASISQLAASNFEKAQSAKNAGDLVAVWRATQAEDTRVLAIAKQGALRRSKSLPVIRHTSTSPDLGLVIPAKHVPRLKRRKTSDEDKDSNQKKPTLYNVNHSSHPGQPQILQKRRQPPPSAFAYQRWADIDTHLAIIQTRLQKDVAAVSIAGLTQPIYNNNGIARALLQGAMFAKLPSQLEVEEKNRAFAKLTALNEIFRAQNMFVTIGANSCGEGPWPQDKYLSHCTRDGTMINIIRAEGIHARNEVRNAGLLHSKYGYNKIIKSDARNDLRAFRAPDPTDVDSDCVFNLSVCDTSLDGT